jgi:hypothetical protein
MNNHKGDNIEKEINNNQGSKSYKFVNGEAVYINQNDLD